MQTVSPTASPPPDKPIQLISTMNKIDNRTIITLAADAKTFVFRAMRNQKTLTRPFVYPSHANNLELCLQNIIKGFTEIMEAMPLDLIPDTPSAISMGFAGPADYAHGIIGNNLPNFEAFTESIALGPLIEKKFGLPVFINNDGYLYAYGEAIAGSLPELNQKLHNLGSKKKYKNIVGITLGTGLGCGIVYDTHLFIGNNACSADLWRLNNYNKPGYILEESISTRGILKSYQNLSGDQRDLNIEDLKEIIDQQASHSEAAQKAFDTFGEQLGELICLISNILDSVIVLGGSLTEMADYFMPSVEKKLSEQIIMKNGIHINKTTSELIYLKDAADFSKLAETPYKMVSIPGRTDKTIYEYNKKTPVIVSRFATSKMISLGAYHYALNQIDQDRNRNSQWDSKF